MSVRFCVNFMKGQQIMARIYPLFSSSKGNSEFLGNPSGGILIDAGVSFKRLCNAVSDCGLDISAVMGVFITHTHSDHVKGLKMLTEKTGIPVFGKYETLSELVKKDMISPKSEIYELDAPAVIAGMEVRCFDTPHDTAGSCGYRIEFPDGRKCVVCTDLGHITKTVDENMLGCDLVLLESNYDEKMLRNGTYPYYLKERILSQDGHLSNECCAIQAERLLRNGTTRIILGHLSQENNTPQTAERTVLGKLSKFKRNIDYILKVAPVETNGETEVF